VEPNEVLMREHRVIELVLACLEELAGRADKDRKLDGASAREAIDFLRTYADRWHHGKEEDRLFPMLEARGLSSHEGPTFVMRNEHRQGRAHIGEMNDTVEGAARGEEVAVARFVSHARSYVSLLREHIQKEDHCLFPIADQALDDDDRRELARQFEEAEREFGDEATPQRYVKLAETLADRLGMDANRS
jgi:hemerythrin-like domain-containing protein